MTDAWAGPGSHAVQFYEDEPFIHRAIAQFLTEGRSPGEPLILVSRPRTFKTVSGHLASGRYGPAIDPGDSIFFIDAEAALPQIMKGEALDLARAENLFRDVLLQARSGHTQGTIRLYGETVDILCQRGRHSTALQLEELATMLFQLEPQLSILCGYAVEGFKDDANAAQFRAVCQKHTHVVPAESFGDALRAHYQQSMMLQRGMLGSELSPDRRTSDATAAPQTVYLIDDDPRIRRSLGRLLTASNWPVRSFDSAEAFLAEVDKLPKGCLVVDIGLKGMSGLELVHRLADAGSSWPIIVMSALHDERTESEALRLGVRACFRKPFDPQALLDAIARALL